jgi:hypothetical protein
VGHPLDVDVEQLRAVAGKVVAVSETIGKVCAARVGDLVPDGAAGAGWESVAAALVASARWGEFARQLAGSVGGLAGQMRVAADSYQETDEDSAREIGRGRYAV